MPEETTSKPAVGVIGLGLLGTALTERLLQGGFPVFVWNRTRHKAEPLEARGAVWSENPIVACDRVVISLYTSEIVKAVLDDMAGGLRAGQILVDTTTGEPQQAAELGKRLARKQVDYLEAPIAASSEQTRRGEAMAIVAGPRDAFEACQDIFDAIVAKAYHVGSWGNAARMKLVNNLILGLNRAALAEGLTFARAIGLAPADALEVLKQGNAYSVVMDVKGHKMVEGDFRVQAKLSQHLKDVRLILEEGAQADARLPFSELHCRLLEELDSAGMGDQDNSVIIRAFARSD